MTTEEFLTKRNEDIVTRLDEIATRVDAIDEERKTLGIEARTLRRERSANMIRLGIPVRPRKAAREAATDE